MPKQTNVEDGARAARRRPANPTVGGATPVGGPAAGGRIVTSEPMEGPIDPTQTLGEEHTTRGLVEAFTIDDERMLIKLNASAISRKLVSVRTSEPHFANAVGLAMMAYNNRDRLSVRYLQSNRPRAGSGPEIVGGLEFGLGEDAFEIDDWPFTYEG